MKKQLLNFTVLLFALFFMGCPDLPTPLNPPPGGEDTTVVVNPPQGVLDLLVGVTSSPKTHDHMDDITHINPRLFRAYYLIEKDMPKGTVPSSATFVATPLEYDKTLDWHVYSNFKRFEKFSEKLGTDQKIMLSTETIIMPDGSQSKFPNKNYLYAQWGSDEKIIEWVHVFIENMNNAIGENKWIWQLSSEPWITDWQKIQKAYIKGWETFEGVKPVLATAALPLGQGQESNKYFEGELTDFVPVEFRDKFTYLTFHSYSLDNKNEWVKDTGINKKDIDAAVKFRDDHMPKAILRMTEFNFPLEVDEVVDQDYQFTHVKEVIDYCKTQNGFDAVYLFNYLPLATNGVFDDCYVVKKNSDFKTKTYDLLDLIEN